MGSLSRITTLSPSTTVVRIFTAFLQQATLDSESTSHVSEEAPIDSFVQLPETESDCHQSDRVIEFDLFDLRGLNVVFKILMFMSAGPSTTGYTDLIGFPITVMAVCMVHVHE
jgi:hypothetical protein